jgi:hypothetical protein
MQWRTLITLSAVLGVTFTVFEIVLTVHRQETLIEDMATYYRIVASTTVTIALLCLICGLVGSSFHQFVGLTRSQAAVAGALAPSAPLAIYLGGFDVPWNHDQHWI